MKLYKKCKNDLRYKKYHELAKEYLELNGVNVKYYMWYGMAHDLDIVKTDKGYFYFNIDNKKLVKIN